jgi:hypothetical protein
LRRQIEDRGITFTAEYMDLVGGFNEGFVQAFTNMQREKGPRYRELHDMIAAKRKEGDRP